MNFSFSSSPTQRRKKARCLAMAGGLVILDWIFMAITGLGLGILLVVISVLTAMA